MMLCSSGIQSSDYSVIIIVWCVILINKLIDCLCPGSKAVKRSLLLLLLIVCVVSGVQTVVRTAVAHTALVDCSTPAGRAPAWKDGRARRARSPWKPAAAAATTKTKVTLVNPSISTAISTTTTTPV